MRFSDYLWEDNDCTVLVIAYFITPHRLTRKAWHNLGDLVIVDGRRTHRTDFYANRDLGNGPGSRQKRAGFNRFYLRPTSR